ncbi:MAG: hypothetical protein AAFY17_04490, partial [Cyanobacteria bacterium J06642_11]
MLSHCPSMRYAPLAFVSALVAQVLMASPGVAQEIAQANEFTDRCPTGTTAQPLPLVGGEGSEVEKTPRNPPLPVPGPIPGLRIRDNFNTDWEIPGGTAYEKFIVVVVPEESDDYDVEMSLKYGDDSRDRIYNEGDIELTAGDPIVVVVEPRPSLHPYQVNVRVGDESIGNRYRATAIGCLSESTPATADICVPLVVVGGDEDQADVEKRVSALNIPGPFGLGIRNNWNTDWIVPLPQTFSRFVGTVENIDETGDVYDIALSLKYGDDSADEIFNQPGYGLNPEESVDIEAVPDRDGTMPYQVNMYVGGIDNEGARYRAGIQGCY